MRYSTLLYMGAFGSIVAVLGGLAMQGLASDATFGSANLSAIFVPGTDTDEMADKLEEALPDIRDGVKKALPYAFLQFGGYVLFSAGFLAIWRMTKRSLALAASICFVLLGLVTLITFLIMPNAMEDLLNVLRDLGEDDTLTFLPTSLLILAGAGLLGLVVQLGGSVGGGYELYRVGKELDHDLVRGSGILLMVGAIAAFIPLFGAFVLYIALAACGICFYLLATRVSAALGEPSYESMGQKTTEC